MQALQPLIMITEQYDVEEKYDFVTVKGKEYKRTGSSRGPDHVIMQAGERWTWQSDHYGTRTGFKICGTWLCENIFAYVCLCGCVCVCTVVCVRFRVYCLYG